MAFPARSIQDAAFDAFEVYRNDPWDTSEGSFPFDHIYVPRDTQVGASSSRQRILDLFLQSRRAAKVFFSGQVGSGKSSELRKLADDKEILTKFEPIPVRLDDKLNLAQPVDIRLLLLALADALVQHIKKMSYDSSFWQKSPLQNRVKDWIDLLQKLQGGPPAKVEDIKLSETAGFKYFVEVSAGAVVTLRMDENRRDRLLKDELFALPRFTELVSDLINVLRLANPDKQIILLVDDGDKMADTNSARQIYVHHAPTLTDIPCRVVFTFPYWLRFEDQFNLVYQGNTVVTLENIKVTDRENPNILLPQARDFFRDLYRKLIAPDVFLADDEALDVATLFSAGIPREFVRLLQRGFLRAYHAKNSILDGPTMKLGANEVRNEMYPMILSDELRRRRLMRVRYTRKLWENEDKLLLQSLLVVERKNDSPWYDVHPLLTEFIDNLISERRRYAERRTPKSENAPSEEDIEDFFKQSLIKLEI